MADPFSAKELQERARNTAWMVENHAPDTEMNVQVQELDRLVSAAVQLKQTQVELQQTHAPAGCSHRTKRRYRCFDCDLTFCKRCIKAHCRAETDAVFQKWGKAIEQLEEAQAEVKRLRVERWQTLPDEDGEGGITWSMAYADHDMLLMDAERRVESAQAEGMGLQESLTVVGEQLEEARAERGRWADAATMQNDEIQAVLGELEKAGWNGPASPGVEHLRCERDEAQAENDRALGLLRRLVVFADKKVDGMSVTNYQIYTPAGQQLTDDARAFLGGKDVPTSCGGCRRLTLTLHEAKRLMQKLLGWVPDNDVRREAARFLRMSERRVRAALRGEPSQHGG